MVFNYKEFIVYFQKICKLLQFNNLGDYLFYFISKVIKYVRKEKNMEIYEMLSINIVRERVFQNLVLNKYFCVLLYVNYFIKLQI